MNQITLALDWTPNPIHTGFYVAQAQGWYREAGLEVNFLSPEADDYKTLPSDKVAAGEATLAICPSELVIHNHYLGGGGSLIAVAAVLQHSASAFATLSESGITRPRDFDDHKYAFLGLPFEQAVLSQMIYMDGGIGITTNIETPKLETWDHLLRHDADCCWIFKPIEGVEAEHKGLQLHLMDPHAYGIPYGYAPVLVTGQTLLQNQPQLLRDFVQATARGYHFAAENPSEAARMLLSTATYSTTPDEALVLKQQEAVNQYYLTLEGHWGPMKADRWAGFIEWLQEQKQVTVADHMPSYQRGTLQETVFTNRFAEPDSFTEV